MGTFATRAARRNGRAGGIRTGGVAVAVASVASLCVACGPRPPAGGGGPVVAPVSTVEHPAGATLPVVACDWDGNGTDTPATYAGGRWRLGDDRGRAYSEEGVVHGGRVGDVPVCGDWDGDGDDEVGIHRDGVFHLRAHDGPGAATRAVPFGAPGAQPVVGDWDGDGVDTVGVFDEGTWVVSDSPTGRPPRPPFAFGRQGGDRPVVGDWDGDGVDTVGVVRGRDWLLTGPGNGREVRRYVGGPTSGTALVVSRDGVDAPLVAWTPPAPEDPLRVAVLGDSLAVESSAAFEAEMTGRRRPVRVTYDVFGGTAICDVTDRIGDPGRRRPDVYVMAFTGNNITPCARHATGDQLYDLYLRDARRVMVLTDDAVVVWTAPPVMRHLGHARTGPIWRAYRQIVAEHPSRAVLADGGRLLTPGDVYEGSRPCLAFEPCTGPVVDGVRHNVTRHLDGIHLCPGEGADDNWDGCPLESPGAHRYAAAMARPVVDRFLL